LEPQESTEESTEIPKEEIAPKPGENTSKKSKNEIPQEQSSDTMAKKKSKNDIPQVQSSDAMAKKKSKNEIPQIQPTDTIASKKSKSELPQVPSKTEIAQIPSSKSKNEISPEKTPKVHRKGVPQVKSGKKKRNFLKRRVTTVMKIAMRINQQRMIQVHFRSWILESQHRPASFRSWRNKLIGRI